ncbi:FAD-binding oxidoreductase [Haloactinomyces albus]|uniref:FAD/FMN-containing dehydrogenase n=1 Tax=Haloactinomyces albus TaxID=1352928 RepID=A0AAE4CQQ9_9ACTN|nr:FAD-binding oxidoreductase [Haloactinomyces albus]MDR7302938.1 FAD/FMN-containing dehydrogenase [Haloactinomyces albus]
MPSIDAIRELTRQLAEMWGSSRVHLPGDREYADASRLWNAAVAVRPALVVRPRSSAEAATAVTLARGVGVGLSVRGGGHDWAGRALREEGLVLDLEHLRDVHISGDAALFGGGSRAVDVVEAAASHGMNLATGTAGVVGMAGLSLAGGYGPLTGTAGLAVDNLLGAEVVLADGSLVSTDDDPELLWALRGGGGNFGVVTSMRVRLYPDRGLVGGTIVFPWNEAQTVLARYAELIDGAPDGLNVLIEMTWMPDLGPCLLAVPTWSGPPQEAETALAAVERLGTPVANTLAPTSQKDLLAQFDQHVPNGMHWDIRTRTVATLTSELIALLSAWIEERPGPGAGIGLRPLHGAAARVGADDTAFGRRDSHVVLEISAGRGPDEDPEPYRKWVDGVSADVASHALPGGYPNFLVPGQHEQIAHAYGSHADRLVAAKDTYDPDRVFTATPLPLLDVPA